MAGQEAVSLNPETFKAGGGLVDNIDAVITQAMTCLFDYQGKANAAPAIFFKLKDDEGNEHEQYWSVGSAKNWIPNSDNTEFVKVGTMQAMTNDCNGGILLASILNSGFPADKLGIKITVLEGLYAHWERVASPKRNIAGKAQRLKADGTPYEDTVLIVTKIHKLPWDKKGKATAAAAPAAKPAAKAALPAPEAPEAEAEAGDGLGDMATTAVMEILAKEGKPVQRQQLATKVLQALKAHPQRNEIVQLVYKDDFLKGGPWEYKNGSLSMS